MAATLPVQLAEIEQTQYPQAQGFARQAQELYQRPLTMTTANLAAECDLAAKRFIEASEAKRTELKKPILEAGRKLDEFWKTIEKPAVDARQVFRDIVSRYQIQARKEADEARRVAAAKAIEEAERQKKIEVDGLVAEAARTGDKSLLEAAVQVEVAPVVPVVAATPEPPKVAGMTVRMKKVGFVKSKRKLMEFLLQGDRNDLINALIGISESELDRAVAHAVPFPEDAVGVEEIAITTNRMR